MMCKCHPQTAFHWNRPEYIGSINWSRHGLSTQMSQASTDYVNRMRKQGLEVVVITGLNTPAAINPKKFVV